MEETVKLWKLPTSIDIDCMRKLRGNEGTFLNPVQDINDDDEITVDINQVGLSPAGCKIYLLGFEV